MDNRFTIADAGGKELGYLDQNMNIDMDLGDTNDFVFEIPLSAWNRENLDYGYRIYIQDTEYGGIIGDMKVATKTGVVQLSGDTWRGMMAKKIIEPESGEDYRVVSGDLNAVLKSLIEPAFGGLFLVPEIAAGVTVSNYKFDRYCTLLAGIEEMLASKGCRIDIKHRRGDPGIPGWVEVRAVPAEDYSESKEYNQDNRINFTARDYRRGINHLICAGSGEGTDRTVLHLYVDKDGNIGNQQYFKGIDERTALYSYTSQPDSEKLLSDGTKRLKKLMNYKQFEMTVEEVDLSIGDTVSGRDYTTGILVQKPVVQKILKMKSGMINIDYKLKGDD